MDFDTKGAEEVKQVKGGFELLPVDDYVGTIEKVESRETKAGNKYINMMLRITEGKFAKRVLFKPIYLIGKTEETTQKLKGQFRGLMADLGIQPSSKRDTITSVDLLRSEIQGLSVEFNVWHETQERKTSERVGEITAILSPFGESMSFDTSETPFSASTDDFVASVDTEQAAAMAEVSPSIPFGDDGETVVRIREIAIELKINIANFINATIGQIKSTDKLTEEEAELVLLALIKAKETAKAAAGLEADIQF